MSHGIHPKSLAPGNRRLWMCLLATMACLHARGEDPIVGSLYCPDPIKISFSDLISRTGFSAQFWAVNDEHLFLNWSPGGMANLYPVKEVKRMTNIFLAIFFESAGNRVMVNSLGDEMKVSDVTYHWALVRPDGSTHSVYGPISAWSGAAPPSRVLQLVANKPTLMFQPNDPPGRYTVHVLVRDNVRNVNIDLERPLVLRD